MLNEFLDHLSARRLSHNTIRLRRVYLGQLSRTMPLETATTATLAAWLQRPDWSPETLNSATAALRTFYEWAHETGRMHHNPARPLRAVRVPQTPPHMATEQQIHAGLQSNRTEVRAATMLGAECGLRVHEIAKAHRDDLTGEWLTVVGKGGRVRVVHTTPELRAELASLDNPAGYYFPSRKAHREHVSAQTVRTWIFQELGTNPHSLRHRAGTTVYRGTGHDIRLTQEFLGHTSPTTTARYVHIDRDRLRAASSAARLAPAA